MIVGGNIDGVTRVMTTAIALETSKGDLPLALALGVVLLARGRAPQRRDRPGSERPGPRARRASVDGRAASPESRSRWSRCAMRRCRSAPSARSATPASSIHAGESIAVVGANGSGKTTLLRLLHGVVDHSGMRCSLRRRRARRWCSSARSCCASSVLNNVRLALWLGDRRLSAEARTEPRDRGAAAGRSVRPARPAGAIALRRRAAAPGAGARLGGSARHPVPRRADRQPRPVGQEGGRVAARRLRRRRHDARDEHAQSRPGEASGQRASSTWTAAGSTSIFRPRTSSPSTAAVRADLFLKGDLSWSVD